MKNRNLIISFVIAFLGLGIFAGCSHGSSRPYRDSRRSPRHSSSGTRTRRPAPPVEPDNYSPPAYEGPQATVSGLYGILAIDRDAFVKAKELGAKTVQAKGQNTASELSESLSLAKSLGLKLGVRALGKSSFQNGYSVSVSRIRDMTSSMFSQGSVAGDENFSNFYLIDEPCHAGKWDLSWEDMRDAYNTTKAVDGNIVVSHNFGHIGCLQGFVEAKNADAKITDIAFFTVTRKKMRQEPDYISNSDRMAGEIKAIDPTIKIVPMIAVYEYPARNADIPSAQWIADVADEIINADNFDGIFIFPWNASRYIGQNYKGCSGRSCI